MRTLLLKPSGEEEATKIQLERASAARHESYTVTIGDRRVEVELECSGGRRGWLRIGGRVIPYAALRHNSTVEVWVSGRSYTFDIVDRTAKRAADAAATGVANDLTAPMPGTILKINRKPGDSFEAHEALIVMESMKMEMTLSAPREGRVKEILCKEGELVEMGELLVTIEAAHEAHEPDKAS